MKKWESCIPTKIGKVANRQKIEVAADRQNIGIAAN
jgi:hypothetical protein